MRFFWGVAFLAASVCLYAQSVDPDVSKAQAQIDRLRKLVAAGAAPRLQLEKAELALADAQDSAVLRKTLSGQDLTEDQADDMVAAAGRRFERRKKSFDDAKKLVDMGAASSNSLDPLLRDMEMARKECELADSRANLTREIASMAHTEENFELRMAMAPSETHAFAERFDGDGAFNMATFSTVETAFEEHFGHALPVSAMGETAVHRSMGFDHRGRVDVAVNPDSPEGAWLRSYLTVKRIPYFAFRQAVPGKATGAHIHIGPMSGRLANGG